MDEVLRAIRLPSERSELHVVGSLPDGYEGPERRRSDNLGRVVAAEASGVVVLDREGLVRFTNPAADRILGVEHQSLIGTEFGSPISIGRSSQVEVFRGRSEPKMVEMRVTETLWDDDPVYVATLVDVTTEAKEREELRELIDLRSEVLATASHEIRNPLAVIGGFASTLLDQWDRVDDERKKAIVQRVADSATRVQRIVANFLTVAKADAGGLTAEIKELDMTETLLRVLDGLGEGGGGVNLHCATGLVARGDAGYVHQIVVNLVENANKYGAPPIDISASSVNGSIEVRIVDRGPGVPEEFVPSLFERFARSETTASKVEGTGLGLSIVKTLAEAISGEIFYEPVDPTGACFGLRLPRAG